MQDELEFGNYFSKLVWYHSTCHSKKNFKITFWLP